jgi:hypothetical protein
MGMRGGPARRIVANPLGGILRDVDRRTRSTTRRRGSATSPAAVEVPEAPPARPRSSPAAAAVLETDQDGRARWSFPCQFAVPPVLSALPTGDRLLVAVVEEVTGIDAMFRVWTGGGIPAGPGVLLHVRATEVGPP